MKNIRHGITKSAKVFVVLSEYALESGYIRLEIKIAHRFGIDKNKNLLIPVLLAECDIPDELMILTYIDAREGVDEETWWPKLLSAVEANEQGSTPLLTELGWIGNRKTCTNCSIEPSSKNCDRIPTAHVKKYFVIQE
ncbi:hypothetical protein CHS0354_027044 [Potamilus streckersoni]|uniref:TIR domain-containing protein n=1 Tax=Potamilus streckersoni TaxID=2493646 RepID=A0AAE0RMW0_9BIVA|nr:hypothetical protein CHS0354_027044 [Potamilus streckersoni]